jgi:hypothetical protein
MLYISLRPLLMTINHTNCMFPYNCVAWRYALISLLCRQLQRRQNAPMTWPLKLHPLESLYLQCFQAEDAKNTPAEAGRKLKLSPASADLLLGLFFYLENGGDMLLRNVGLWTTRRDNPEVLTLYSHCCVNFTFNTTELFQDLLSFQNNYFLNQDKFSLDL